jgi:hypothetical protein
MLDNNNIHFLNFLNFSKGEKIYLSYIYLYIMDVAINSTTGLPYTSTDFLSNIGNNIGFNPMILLILGVIIVIYYFIFASLGKSSGSPERGSVGHGGIVFLEVLLWGVFIVLVLLNGMSYFFNIDIIASIQNLFSDMPQLQISSKGLGDGTGLGSGSGGIFGSGSGIIGDGSTTVPEIKISKQVFNVPGNYYTYDNAKALCQAYGTRLATYGEVEEAYRKGADWCNYGWSDKQLALFPTSKEKWEKLQTIKGHENDCGRQGVNGGYIGNPNVQFGANCYGYKPKITQTEQLLMNETPLYPQTTEELNFEKTVAHLKTQLPNIMVSPFNNSNWSIV